MTVTVNEYSTERRGGDGDGRRSVSWDENRRGGDASCSWQICETTLSGRGDQR